MNEASLLNVFDYAAVARERLTKETLDYFEGGARDEITLRENTEGWQRLKLYYHVLAGVSTRDLTTKLLDREVSMPIAIAPTAFHKLACAAGEIATARAAMAKAQWPICWRPSRVIFALVGSSFARRPPVRCRPMTIS